MKNPVFLEMYVDWHEKDDKVIFFNLKQAMMSKAASARYHSRENTERSKVAACKGTLNLPLPPAHGNIFLYIEQLLLSDS